jgi:Zn-dependent protease with chaperone function
VISLKASRYDGRSSQRQEVGLDFDEYGFVRVHGTDIELRYACTDVRLAPAIGNLPRELRFPDGSLCEVAPHPLLDGLLATAAGQFASWLHRGENSFRYALAALAVTVIVVWAGIEYGIPVLARQVAYALPLSTESQLGDGALEALDHFVFSPSRLAEQRRTRITTLFTKMKRAGSQRRDYQLVFRRSPRIGANALALPSGIIVLTDELVGLAQHDEEIVAVLAHEVGHVDHGHSLRWVLQNSASGLLIASLTGDILSASSFAAALPTMLLQARYSREFEAEADTAAADYLRCEKISLTHFANILKRLADAHIREGKDTIDYFSTHPSTVERIERLRAIALQRDIHTP